MIDNEKYAKALDRLIDAKDEIARLRDEHESALAAAERKGMARAAVIADVFADQGADANQISDAIRADLEGTK